MHIALSWIGCWLLSLPVVLMAQAPYEPQIADPQAHLEALRKEESTFLRKLDSLETKAQYTFSANERFYLDQITRNLKDGNAEFLTTILQSNQAFAEKLHTLTDTTRWSAYAQALSEQNTAIRAWENALAGVLPEPPPTFFAEAALLNIRPGEDVLEVGAGNGAFLTALAWKYPQATYWLNELNTDYLDQLSTTYQRTSLPTDIYLVQGQVTETGMPPMSTDKVLMRQVLHHLETPGALLTDIRRGLRPTGRLYVLENFAGECALCCPDSWTEQAILETMRNHGFRLVAAHRIPESTFHLLEWAPAAK